jgi:hemoglobin-like flavoprotein
MNEDTIHLLQTSFAEFAKSGLEGATLFYERLFALDPSLKPLFSGADLTQQKAKLMAALGLVVNGLRDLAKVVPVLEALSLRHINYGVQESHYETVGTALIQALSLYFGPRFSADMRAAWTGAYGVVSGVMIDAVRRSQVADLAAE